MSENNTTAVAREKQLKLAQGRVAAVEKYYGLFCETLGSVIRKSARLRDKSDIFVHQLKDYADTERLNTTTRSSLLSFAENLSAVQDYRNAEVQRLEAKVLKPLTKYGDLCKNIKRSIKNSQSSWVRESKQSQKLQKLQQKVPEPTVQIAQAELQKAHKQSLFHDEQLLVDVDQFEKCKLTDMKTVLSEFVRIEMIFHARALEYFSRCYEAAQQIETTADMDYLQTTLLESTASQPLQQFAQVAMPNYTYSESSAAPRRMMYDEEVSDDESQDYDDEDEDS